MWRCRPSTGRERPWNPRSPAATEKRGVGGNQVFLKISAIWTSRTSPPRRVNSELNLSTTAQDKHVCHQRFWAETVFYTGSPPYSVNGLLWKLRN